MSLKLWPFTFALSLLHTGLARKGLAMYSTSLVAPGKGPLLLAGTCWFQHNNKRPAPLPLLTWLSHPALACGKQATLLS